MNYFLLYVYMYMAVGIISFFFNYTHLLNSLLSLEFLGVGLYIGVSVYCLMVGGLMVFSVFYLVMLVIESVLGLSLLVIMCFSQGSDNMVSSYSCLC